MSRETDIKHIVSERIAIAASTLVGITLWPGQIALTVKYFSGGSLEIGGTYSLSAGATAAFASGNGYLLGVSEVLSIDMSGTDAYLAATGSTSVAHVIRYLTGGVYNR